VLLVDDELELLEIMAASLVHMGFKEVLTAKDGQEAFIRIQSRSIDLLVTDIRMPVMDGVGLVRSIAELQQVLPMVVFVSGFADVDKEEMYALGVVAFMSKPCNRFDLSTVLQKALADRSTLWQEPMSETPRQAILIKSDLGYSASGQEVRVGRGGFSAPYCGPFSRGKVFFQCETGTLGHNLSGEGDIRWVSRINGRIGIEFSYLDESCRSWVFEGLSTGAPRSFIPCS